MGLSVQFSSVQSVRSNSLGPHGLQYARLPCLSPTPGACSNSCPLSQWCHPTTSSSVIPFSSCLQPFPASGSFPMSQFFASGGQSYWSFSFSTSPSNKYSGLISFRTDWFDLLAVQWTLKSLLQHHISKASILRCSAFFMVQLSHPSMTTAKTIALTENESQLCPTIWDPMYYTVHGILQATILEWIAYPFSGWIFLTQESNQVSCIAGRFFTNWAMREAQSFDYMDLCQQSSNSAF